MRPGFLLALALMPFAVALRAAEAQSVSPPDVIFAGAFVTLDSTHPRAEAVAVRRGVIAAIGTLAQVEATAGPRTRRIRLAGVALPGFADAHAHPLALGTLLETVDLHGLSKEATLERVTTAAGRTPPGQWIRGDGWDQSQWSPPVFPTADPLDRVSGGHPVLLTRIDGHAVWVNHAALRLAAITRATADPPGGRIIRDSAGTPTGVLVDAAIDLLTRAVPEPTPAIVARRLEAAFARYLRWGLTSVHDAGESAATIEIYRSLAQRRRIPLRMYVMASTDSVTLERTLARGPTIGLGGGMLTIRSLKVVLDGALGSRGAELSSPYADATTERGLPIVSDATLDSIIRRGGAAGFQINVHAIGDQANHRTLDGFERAGSVARTMRFRNEHASMLRDEDVARLARLGIVASMQPVFVGEYSRFAEARVGPSRLPWVYRTADVVATGATLASGTDFPASDTGDPMATLSSLVTRRGADGTPSAGWLPGQAVSLEVALRSMTAGPAFASFEDHRLGSLTVGRRADFTVLSGDPYTTAPTDLRSLRVLATVVNGVVRFDDSVAKR